MKIRTGIVCLMGACLLAAACNAAPEDSAGLDSSPALEPMEGPIGMNGLDPVDFWAPATQAALRSLGGGALLDRSGALVSTDLLDTAEGRSVLGYAMRCALDDGSSVSGDGYTFDGLIGLAPAWASRGLTTPEQRWMTACLLQHLNGLGVHVPIMLEGSHPALDPVAGEDTSDFTVPDATAYGNLFTSSPSAYVCANVGLDLGCGLGWSTDLLTRLCGLSPTCGVSVLHLCALSCTYDSEGDPTCGVLLGATYAESIATKVEETGFLSLYPLCSLP